MDANYDIFEIVAVISDFRLVDSESFQRRYCTNHGQTLAPGYYVVNWPEHIRVRRFNGHAAFHGPFKLRKEAQAALDWMQKEREHFLTRSSGLSSGVGPNASRMEVKKAGSQKLRPAMTHKLSKPFAAKNRGNRDYDLSISGKP
ncbi:hypothetical protein [Methylomicrobium lacus]|uniref:hypothetical protein n=1 Tax=Methylomicrobium lacus TaxID=136992 RepID=UPI00045E652B|nr:hypothetical protein [Methylomicrobium lacus]